ncbi:PglL family O-oligosaccharyltransferase [Piscinibacter gummiphilus]|uniref:Wzy polymerase domain-containing protein n=1 Tax=Piscinibacter gummiphilus TaxID=946333 RepID=A0ABZ0CUI4_9BURK|nr:Wzy polymerase domain-containing protein [Piscinibacter gummiphilus]WOB08528.1 Wzy polymerase domain-containing protein [Piscinibacter gummiphilus]
MLHALPLALAGIAICGPAWLAHNVSPSATFFNQATALTGWAALTIWAFGHCMPAVSTHISGRSIVMALLVPALLALGAIGSVLLEGLPASLMLSACGLLAVAALVLLAAMLGSQSEVREELFAAVSIGTVVAGGVSVLIALIQVLAPSVADGEWISRASTAGRAGGNLRQPNHLSSLLLGAMAASVWLHEARVKRTSGEATIAQCAIAAGLMAALTLGVVLTVSRTGTVCIALLALWGVVDKRLAPFSRALLSLTPLVYALCWLGMSEWAKASEFAGAVQLHKSDPSSSRFGIWANTLSLIAQNPWFGVGWGEFNFAWSLTPFPNRPVAFFDHTHNLPLNLLVELGVPLGTLVLVLLAWLLWKAFIACRTAPPPESAMVRTAFVMVLMMAVHSMLEYPLWYAYFLLPTAFALGICLGHSTPPPESKPVDSPWPRRLLMSASLVLVLGTVFSVFDYLRVTKIFSVDEDDTTPLSYRIAEGQKSIFFAHHADYAAATVATHPSTAWKAFRRAPHLLLDTRLMMAWAKAYAEKGDVERARYIADRLREFRNPDSAEFFAECDKPRPPGIPEPFQCKSATRHFTYEDFKLR